MSTELEQCKFYARFLERYIIEFKKPRWTRITDDPKTWPPLDREVLVRDKPRKGPQHWLYTFKTHRTMRRLHVGHEWFVVDAIGDPIDDLQESGEAAFRDLAIGGQGQ